MQVQDRQLIPTYFKPKRTHKYTNTHIPTDSTGMEISMPFRKNQVLKKCCDIFGVAACLPAFAGMFAHVSVRFL